MGTTATTNQNPVVDSRKADNRTFKVDKKLESNILYTSQNNNNNNSYGDIRNNEEIDRFKSVKVSLKFMYKNNFVSVTFVFCFFIIYRKTFVRIIFSHVGSII